MPDPTLPALDKLRAWREDCNLYAREVFNMVPDNWQGDVFDAYSNKTTDKYRIALKACKAPGKTAAEAIMGLHFLTLYPFPKIVCTSITGDNLRDNLWAEFRKWMRRSEWIQRAFVWTKERIFCKEHPEEWWISARKWARDADAEQQANTLAGIHAEYVLFILDEAGGIPDAVAAAAEGGMATGKVVKLIIGGNPTHASGPLYRACTSERDLWWVKEINGDPDNPDRAPRVKIKWAREQIRKYGRKSPYVMVNVLGQFPTGATDCVLAIDWLEDAFNRYGMPCVLTPRILGADIARYGTDLTVITSRIGDRIDHVWEWQGENTQTTALRIKDIFNDLDYDEVRVDDIGVGGGVTDRLEEEGVNVVPVNVGESPIDDEESHINLRSELYGDLQEVFIETPIQINPKIRDETSLVAEGTTLKVEFNDKNKRRIEPKQKFKVRTGRSPNYLDSLMLAHADRVALKSVGGAGGAEGEYRGNYNPYEQRGRLYMPRSNSRIWTPRGAR